MLRTLLSGSVGRTFARTSVRCSSSSTSAMAYKQMHKHHARPPLPVVETPSWDANAAVSSILYETPPPSTQPRKQHVLNCLVQNEPGVLSRVSGTLAARGFNIDSLIVCNTEVKDLSRMTIVLQGQDNVIEQARRQIEDLVPVYAVLNYTESQLVKRELLLCRVSLLGAEYFEDLLLHHHQRTAGPRDTKRKESELIDNIRNQEYHPSNMAPSAVLRMKHEHLNDITNLSKNFGGKIVDISETSCIVELAAKPTRVSAFLKLVEPFGILEVTRSGMMALPRTPLQTSREELEGADEQSKISDIVDISQLPPG
ncbi:acetolactate synthase regulatory subunit KNAG_0I01210 [Huiozyma naganishii CBS 8797]|uniref:ACT domain-containing protein n=1 Tax=Huiozyma naganishii (strain ATCC MYA-139 / BCRC 22969 / CBS 8797 / KCTC 17520 / NBRC 10181 / NCYC 3082 / Yp74L-3) TaxID=1071383 RepID=J7S298_HUIN7|nr:hypothetical protein KNAG_0I01210 [Kazachstania naganishii CBS 8797]CCK71912.1 hypothetical protein KNAG_0I01210 [Kazachstania naganishii CBS 8797]